MDQHSTEPQREPPQRWPSALLLVAVLVLVSALFMVSAGCSDDGAGPDSDAGLDGGAVDAGDAALPDAQSSDAALSDAGADGGKLLAELEANGQRYAIQYPRPAIVLRDCLFKKMFSTFSFMIAAARPAPRWYSAASPATPGRGDRPRCRRTDARISGWGHHPGPRV